MSIQPALKSRLLGAIVADTLVFLCGAGLSVAPPSNLPLAAELSEICYEKWRPSEPTLDPTLAGDLDRLAGHFHARGQFETVFIKGLVPWDALAGPPNEGHAAIADLLICRGARAALSANVDCLIEHWAGERRVALRGALNGQEAASSSGEISPLVKIHGCMTREPAKTLWTHAQLNEPDIAARTDSLSSWIRLHLPGKDLVVVGFWTDWGYLNNVLADALLIEQANSVTVIDPSPIGELRDKAPALWDNLSALSGSFEHLQESGAELLAELRAEYSRAWARRFFTLGVGAAAVSPGSSLSGAIEALGSDDLYDLRRDAEPVPYTHAARRKTPPDNGARAASLYAELLDAGATQDGAWLEFEGQLIRILNAGGFDLARLRGQYNEPPTWREPDIVVYAGGYSSGAPPRVIPLGRGASVMGSAPGGGARWLSFDEARAEFRL